MEASADLQDLLEEAFRRSEIVIKKLGGSFYTSTPVDFNKSVFPKIDIRALIQQITDLLVKEYKLPPSIVDVYKSPVSNETLGICTRYNARDKGSLTKFVIQVEKSLNECRYRFVLLKEICQIFCDQVDGRTETDIANEDRIVYRLLKQRFKLDLDPKYFTIKITDDNYTEFLSFYMAINLIFPPNFRDIFKSLAQPLIDDPNEDHPYTLYDLANILKMPEYILHFFVREILPVYEQLKDN